MNSNWKDELNLTNIKPIQKFIPNMNNIQNNNTNNNSSDIEALKNENNEMKGIIQNLLQEMKNLKETNPSSDQQQKINDTINQLNQTTNQNNEAIN